MLTLHRDGTTPEKQAEQIMAIFPIVKGQKWEPKHVIPPRTPNEPPHPEDGNLVDVSDSHPTLPPIIQKSPEAEAPKANPPIDSSHASTTEIQEMLSSTGTRGHDGPLVDFHKDMKTALPTDLKRTDTEESNDEFVDAQG